MHDIIAAVRAVAHAFGQVDTLLDTVYIPSIENISLPFFTAHFCYTRPLEVVSYIYMCFI